MKGQREETEVELKKNGVNKLRCDGYIHGQGMNEGL
jgi:hypothetical protein